MRRNAVAMAVATAIWLGPHGLVAQERPGATIDFGGGMAWFSADLDANPFWNVRIGSLSEGWALYFEGLYARTRQHPPEDCQNQFCQDRRAVVRAGGLALGLEKQLNTVWSPRWRLMFDVGLGAYSQESTGPGVHLGVWSQHRVYGQASMRLGARHVWMLAGCSEIICSESIRGVSMSLRLLLPRGR